MLLAAPFTCDLGRVKICPNTNADSNPYVATQGEIVLEHPCAFEVTAASVGTLENGEDAGVAASKEQQLEERPQTPTTPRDSDEARQVGRDEFFGQAALVISAEESAAGYKMTPAQAGDDAATATRATRWRQPRPAMHRRH